MRAPILTMTPYATNYASSISRLLSLQYTQKKRARSSTFLRITRQRRRKCSRSANSRLLSTGSSESSERSSGTSWRHAQRVRGTLMQNLSWPASSKRPMSCARGTSFLMTLLCIRRLGSWDLKVCSGREARILSHY